MFNVDDFIANGKTTTSTPWGSRTIDYGYFRFNIPEQTVQHLISYYTTPHQNIILDGEMVKNGKEMVHDITSLSFEYENPNAYKIMRQHSLEMDLKDYLIVCAAAPSKSDRVYANNSDIAKQIAYNTIKNMAKNKDYVEMLRQAASHKDFYFEAVRSKLSNLPAAKVKNDDLMSILHYVDMWFESGKDVFFDYASPDLKAQMTAEGFKES